MHSKCSVEVLQKNKDLPDKGVIEGIIEDKDSVYICAPAVYRSKITLMHECNAHFINNTKIDMFLYTLYIVRVVSIGAHMKNIILSAVCVKC